MTACSPSPSQLRLLLLASPTRTQQLPLSSVQKKQERRAALPVLQSISLPYPSCSGAVVDFYVRGETVYEINKSCRSMGTCSALLPPQLVLGDGSLLVATPVDPLLLLLPQLRQLAASAFLPLLEAIAPQQLSLEVRHNLCAVAKQPGVLRRLHYLCDIRLLACPPASEAEAAQSADTAAPVGSDSACAVVTNTKPVSAEEGAARRAAVDSGSLFVRFNIENTMDFLLRKHAKLGAAIAAERSEAVKGGTSNAEEGNSPASSADRSAASLAFHILSAYLPKAVSSALEQQLRKKGVLIEDRPSISAAVTGSAKTATNSTSKADQPAGPQRKLTLEKTGTRAKRTSTAAAAAKKSTAKRRA